MLWKICGVFPPHAQRSLRIFSVQSLRLQIHRNPDQKKVVTEDEWQHNMLKAPYVYCAHILQPQGRKESLYKFDISNTCLNLMWVLVTEAPQQLVQYSTETDTDTQHLLKHTYTHCEGNSQSSRQDLHFYYAQWALILESCSCSLLYSITPKF